MSDTKVLVTQSQARRFTADAAMTIAEYFSGSDLTPASLVTGDLDGRHGRRRNQRSAKLYYVVSGELVVDLDGRNYELQPRDALLIRPGEPHAMEGRAANVVIVCTPAFDAADEVMEE
jgi:quercetin dioxygenase-like cupin family protein